MASYFDGLPVRTIELDSIERLDPKRTDTTQGIDELAQAIADGGVTKRPVIVVPGSTPGRYKLLAGFRRVRAFRKLGYRDVKVVILDLEEFGLRASCPHAPRQIEDWFLPSEMLAIADHVADIIKLGLGSREAQNRVGRVFGIGGQSTFLACRRTWTTALRCVIDAVDNGSLTWSRAGDLSSMGIPPEDQERIVKGELPMPPCASTKAHRKRQGLSESDVMAPPYTVQRKNGQPQSDKPSELKGKSAACVAMIENIDTILETLGKLRSQIGRSGGDLKTHKIDTQELDRRLKLARQIFTQVRGFVKGQ